MNFEFYMPRSRNNFPIITITKYEIFFNNQTIFEHKYLKIGMFNEKLIFIPTDKKKGALKYTNIMYNRKLIRSKKLLLFFNLFAYKGRYELIKTEDGFVADLSKPIRIKKKEKKNGRSTRIPKK